ncbi:MAG: class I SAM-dependent methyltransferase [Opitutaceae bacterium]
MSRDVTQRFSDRVANYVRYRPGYPVELIDTLRQRTKLSATSTIADIGSGTGIFTALLLPHAGSVQAVEPNEPMRAYAESTLGNDARFKSIGAPAEATPLPDGSVDLITVAQAFHWLDPVAARREFARILKPGGYVALIWNERLTDTTPFLRDYENLLKTAATDYNQVNHMNIDHAAIAAFYAPAPFETFTFANRQQFDRAGLIGRALSSSYVPNAGQPGHDAFLAGLNGIFDRHAVNGSVAFDYETKLHLGRLTV